VYGNGNQSAPPAVLYGFTPLIVVGWHGSACAGLIGGLLRCSGWWWAAEV